ncbi:MAG TPA: hypothetical protein VN452_00410 [Longilinea sp.]|nr:hypothetical protein [Longilinea sp.]
MKSNPWFMIIGLILLILLAVGLGRAMMPVTPALTHDTATYLNAAENLASNGRLQIDMTLTTDQAAARRFCAYMPGYPIFLSGLLRLGISEEAALYGLSLVGLALTAILSAVLVWILAHSLPAALLTGGALLIFQPLLNVLTYALTETLYIPATLGLILVVVYYVRSDRPGWKVLIALVLLMAAATMLRLVGGMLVAIAGGVLVLRSLLAKRPRRALAEVGLTALSQIPAFVALGANYLETGRFYCATNSAGWDIERTTRGWLARLLFEQFKPDLSLGLGFRSFAENMPIVILIAAAALIALIVLLYVWRNRPQFISAFRDLVNWPVLAMLVYLVLYFGFFFALGNSWAQWDFPRYFVPAYPFIIVLLGLALTALFRRLKSRLVRVLIGLVLAGILLAYIQTSLSVVAAAPLGRGFETAAVRDHPVMAYLRQNLRDSDLLFSTRESTLWYYFRRPVRRAQFLNQVTCQQLQQPPIGARSIFVLFPEGNYAGDPVSAENENWFRSWIAPCGTVTDHQVFKDTAFYIVEPLQKP